MVTLSRSGLHGSRSQSYPENEQAVGTVAALCAGAACDAGLVRDCNEDRCFFRTFVYTGELGSERGLIAAVADGMGGHAAGEAASERAIQVLASTFSGMSSGRVSRKSSPNWTGLIQEAFNLANSEINREAVKWSGRSGMGTTLTTAAVVDGVLYIGHIGDSRAYLVRNGGMVQLTNDHTWVAKRVREGRMTEEEAKISDRRGQLTEALGLREAIEPDVDAVHLLPGDRIVLCTDGLTEMLSDEEILAAACERGDAQRVAARLVAAANRAGGYDNVAVAVVDCLSEPDGSQFTLPKLPKRTPRWLVALLAVVVALLLADTVFIAQRYDRGPRPPISQSSPSPASGVETLSGDGSPGVPEISTEMLDLGRQRVEVETE
ncbi:MAG: serine/threonine-protein phosphatase [Armatimonadetes bacterium]|nr:serine/threonine-protein phosphatase [Armatimonadota bacterium]